MPSYMLYLAIEHQWWCKHLLLWTTSSAGRRLWTDVRVHPGGRLLQPRSSAAESPLHPLVLAEIDRLEAAVDPSLHVQLRPIFGQNAVSRPLVAANRVPHRRDAPRQPLLQLPGLQNNTAAAQDKFESWRRRCSILSCSPAPAAPLPTGLPPDFDPRAYVENHPERDRRLRSLSA